MDKFDRFQELRELISSLEADADKFFNKHNNAAGTRLRKGLQDLKNLAQKIRIDVTNETNNGGPRKTT